MSEQINSTLPENQPPTTPTNLAPNNEVLSNSVTQTVAGRLQQTFKEHPLPTVAVGVGIIVATPLLIRLLKPVARTVIKGGVTLYEKTRVTLAENAETFGDIVAEAKAEAISEAENRAKIKADILSKQSTPNP